MKERSPILHMLPSSRPPVFVVAPSNSCGTNWLSTLHFARMMRIRRLLLFLDRLKGAVLLRVVILFLAVGCAMHSRALRSMLRPANRLSGRHDVVEWLHMCKLQVPCSSVGVHARRHQLRQRARDDIRAAAGRVRHDDANGFRGITLRRHRSGTA